SPLTKCGSPRHIMWIMKPLYRMSGCFRIHPLTLSGTNTTSWLFATQPQREVLFSNRPQIQTDPLPDPSCFAENRRPVANVCHCLLRLRSREGKFGRALA